MWRLLRCCRLVGTVGKGMRAWHVDTKRMVAHMRLEPLFPDVWDVACSPTEPTIACASSASQSQSKLPLPLAWKALACQAAHHLGLLACCSFDLPGRPVRQHIFSRTST